MDGGGIRKMKTGYIIHRLYKDRMKFRIINWLINALTESGADWKYVGPFCHFSLVGEMGYLHI
jgi:hypothetical protein